MNENNAPPMPPLPVEADYDPATVSIFKVNYDQPVNFEYQPLFDIHDVPRFEPSFEMPLGINASATVLNELFLPDHLITKWADCTNAYALSQVELPAKRKHVTKADILRFLATCSYMGVVRLPAKSDYFPGKNSNYLPSHPLIRINKTMFDYLWVYFHTSYHENDDDDEILDDDDGGDDDGGFSNDDESNDDDTDSADERNGNVPVEDPVWFEAIKGFVDHVNKVSKKLCKHPGWMLSIDEMLRKFKGRSSQTVRMKCKPDKEGYKFMAICCAQTGYVFGYFPNGRQDKDSIKDIVEKLIQMLPRKDTLKYVLAMDNYFTGPTVIEMTRNYNIGVFGTARRQRGWPPAEFKRIDDNRFNTLYWMHDKKNFLIMRWVDNKPVDFVSTVHTGNEVVDKARKRPRVTHLNRRHVSTVWGDDWVTEITMPSVVAHYNIMMGGVDKAYQMISYYRPKLRCRRIWMPMFFHSLDICRLNAYIIAQREKIGLTHKDFILEWISSFNDRAEFFERQRTRAAVSTILSPPSSNSKKRMSHTKPKLPEYRLSGQPTDHVIVISDSQRSCTYCRYLYAKAKQNETQPLPKVKKPTRKCLVCNDHLCSDHFDVFHKVESD